MARASTKKITPPTDPVAAAKARYTPKVRNFAFIISTVALALLTLVFVYDRMERGRALQIWQDKLNYIADGKAQQVQDWVQGHFKGLTDLADNASLQVYVSTLGDTAESATGGDTAEATFLRNLLIHTAQNLGFENPEQRGEQINANVNKLGYSGLALVTTEGRTLVATAGMPPIEGELTKTIQDAPRGKATLIDFKKTPQGTMQIGFIVPVFGIQSDRDPSEQLGSIVGIKEVSNSQLQTLMALMQARENSSMEASLVRVENDNVAYLTPLLNNKAVIEPLTKRVAWDDTLDAGFATKNSGAFGIKKDYRNKTVLVTGRAIELTPWNLVLKIDESDALSANNAWRSSMMMTAIAIIAVIVALMYAIWRNASSRRAYELAVESNKLAAQSAAQEKLLRLVTDNQPESIYIVDKNNHFWFANAKAAKLARIDKSDMMGKTLDSVFGPARAKEIVEANAKALLDSTSVSTLRRVSDEDKQSIVRSEHIPLTHIPVDSLPEPSQGVLVVEHDITEVVYERERRAKAMKQLIDTLVMLVDQRDPYSANHSAYVAQIARDIASEMKLEQNEVDTTEIAGRLMNIGKIVVPSELLTKRESLNDSEMKTIRNSIYTSADLLQGIDFDGPVVETLRQSQEYMDGSGPRKLKEEQILISARIIGVANAFVGMISPRSYRSAITIDEACKTLLENIGAKYDQRVVVALINNIENHGGKEAHKIFSGNKPKKATSTR